MNKIIAIVIAVITGIMLIIAATRKTTPGEPPSDGEPPSGDGAILEFSIEPKQIYQQESVAIRVKAQNTGNIGEIFYARVYIDGQWSGSIISNWLNPGEVLERWDSITLYNAGTFTATCDLTGYEKEDVRARASTQVTVLPRELPNSLTLLPEPLHLYDRSRNPNGYYQLAFPSEASPHLTSIPKAYFKGTELAMDIKYNLRPNIISDKYRQQDGWYWELCIFNEGDDYYYPWYPTHPEPRGPAGERIGGGARPSWRKYFDYQVTKTSASTSRWEPSLKNAPGRYPIVIVAWYKGLVAGYYDLMRTWKTGEIVVPQGQLAGATPPNYYATWEEQGDEV